MPESEAVLWSRLQGKALRGYKFRRQYGIGPYVVDFYCPKVKLVIEIDGYSHFSKEAKEYDKERELYIDSLGLQILRFTNVDIQNNLIQVLEKISNTLFDSPLRHRLWR